MTKSVMSGSVGLNQPRQPFLGCLYYCLQTKQAYGGGAGLPVHNHACPLTPNDALIVVNCRRQSSIVAVNSRWAS